MPWSTKELADLSDTSVRIIRHYHAIGLLAEPPRLTNGYKQYGVADLVRVLRIHRLSGLGFSLEQISRMLDSPADTDAALDELDTEIAGTIARLERVRSEIASIRQLGAPADMRPEAFLMMDAFDHDVNLAILTAHLIAPPDLALFAEALSDMPAEYVGLNERFLGLASDAHASEIERLTEDMVESLSGFSAYHPECRISDQPSPVADGKKVDAFVEMMTGSLNPAQSRVFNDLVSKLSRMSS